MSPMLWFRVCAGVSNRRGLPGSRFSKSSPAACPGLWMLLETGAHQHLEFKGTSRLNSSLVLSFNPNHMETMSQPDSPSHTCMYVYIYIYIDRANCTRRPKPRRRKRGQLLRRLQSSRRRGPIPMPGFRSARLYCLESVREERAYLKKKKNKPFRPQLIREERITEASQP